MKASKPKRTTLRTDERTHARLWLLAAVWQVSINTAIERAANLAADVERIPYNPPKPRMTA